MSQIFPKSLQIDFEHFYRKEWQMSKDVDISKLMHTEMMYFCQKKKTHECPYAYGQPYVQSIFKVHIKFKRTYKLEALKTSFSAPDGRRFIGNAQKSRSTMMLLQGMYLSVSFY